MILVILKLLVVFVFLIMFIRRPTVAWGIGLLTVTTAALLDTLLGTFNREELLAELGFFFYVISGVLLAGAAAWFWGVVRPWLPGGATAAPTPAVTTAAVPFAAPVAEAAPPKPAPKLPPPLPADHVDQFAEAGYDRQMLYEEVRRRFSRADLRDLMFDLEIDEQDIAVDGQSIDELIVQIMDAADREGKASTVALAVERILTPPPPEHLPRLEKLTADSPRTVVRHYLLAHYTVEQLQRFAAELGIDWEQLGAGDKKDKVRNLLLSLYRRNRIEDLLTVMRAAETPKRGRRSSRN